MNLILNEEEIIEIIKIIITQEILKEGEVIANAKLIRDEHDRVEADIEFGDEKHKKNTPFEDAIKRHMGKNLNAK